MSGNILNHFAQFPEVLSFWRVIKKLVTTHQKAFCITLSSLENSYKFKSDPWLWIFFSAPFTLTSKDTTSPTEVPFSLLIIFTSFWSQHSFWIIMAFDPLTCHFLGGMHYRTAWILLSQFLATELWVTPVVAFSKGYPVSPISIIFSLWISLIVHRRPQCLWQKDGKRETWEVTPIKK